MAILSDFYFLRAFMRNGVAPAIEHAALLRQITFDFLLDVGANRGQFSLVCRRQKPGARIVAFEPLPGPAAVYRALFAGDANVRLHQVALGTQRGTVPMHVSARDDSSSLLPIAEAQVRNFPGSHEVGTHDVTMVLLPDLIKAQEMGRHNVLKIDVQGFELEVLKSAETLLALFDHIYVECSYVPLYVGQSLAGQVIAFLEARGFAQSGRYNPSYIAGSRDLLQADLLFRRVV